MVARTPVPEHLRPTEPPATERQEAYLKSLLESRELPQKDDRSGEQRRQDALTLLAEHKFSKVEASKTIEFLLPLPTLKDRPPAAPADLPAVPDGRYAIEREGVLKFYRVRSPQEGRWVGYTFIDAQASDELHPVRGLKTKAEILETIAKDINGAMARYGQEIGSCGRCGRTLTDETSRALGIGPVCRGEMGL